MENVSLSRVEKILLAKLNGESIKDKPMSRIEELLIGLNVSGGNDTADLTQKVLALKGSVEKLSEQIEKSDSQMVDQIIKILSTGLSTDDNGNLWLETPDK